MAKIFLTGWEETTNVEKLGIKPRLLSELLNLSVDTVKRYRSDFYHDVKWIEENVNGPMTFFYGFDESGTAIGTDEHFVRVCRKNVYRVVLSHEDDRAWYVELQNVSHVCVACLTAHHENVDCPSEALDAAYSVPKVPVCRYCNKPAYSGVDEFGLGPICTTRPEAQHLKA